jgi:hypothetical protein
MGLSSARCYGVSPCPEEPVSNLHELLKQAEALWFDLFKVMSLVFATISILMIEAWGILKIFALIWDK